MITPTQIKELNASSKSVSDSDETILSHHVNDTNERIKELKKININKKMIYTLPEFELKHKDKPLP